MCGDGSPTCEFDIASDDAAPVLMSRQNDNIRCIDDLIAAQAFIRVNGSGGVDVPVDALPVQLIDLTLIFNGSRALDFDWPAQLQRVIVPKKKYLDTDRLMETTAHDYYVTKMANGDPR